MTAFTGRDAHLKRLVQQVGELNRLLQSVQKAVPAELAAHCISAAWSGSTLLIGVSSSAAASRVRLATPQILTNLQGYGLHASAIRVRVQVALQTEKLNPPKTLHMTDQAMDAFSALAGSVSDPGLRTAITALLRHHGHSKSSKNRE